MNRVVGQEGLVERQEVADVVCDQDPSQLPCGFQDDEVVLTQQLLVVALNRLYVPPASPQLDRDLRIQHLVAK